jgi:hypothetical protein
VLQNDGPPPIMPGDTANPREDPLVAQRGRLEPVLGTSVLGQPFWIAPISVVPGRLAIARMQTFGEVWR